MKAEFLHGWHQRRGDQLAERFFACPETALSQGYLEHAKRTAEQRLHEWYPAVQAGALIIGQEPSELLTIRDEWLDLVVAADWPAARAVADHAAAIAARCNGAGQTVHVHGHCHAKAQRRVGTENKRTNGGAYPYILEGGYLRNRFINRNLGWRTY